SNAKGLGQIKPFNFPYLGIKDPFDIEQNVRGTTLYLSKLLKKWRKSDRQIELALASYIEGHNGIKRSGGKYSRATAAYIQDILKIYSFLKS
ncbi:lytic transglycosylase, partial [Candidatus Magnetomorum sp. HK-1]